LNQTTLLLILVLAALVGLVAMVLITRRQRRDRADETRENPYATSSEGQKRCPSCGAYNAWTDRSCVSCHRKLPG
jgi:hypothetical protein